MSWLLNLILLYPRCHSFCLLFRTSNPVPHSVLPPTWLNVLPKDIVKTRMKFILQSKCGITWGLPYKKSEIVTGQKPLDNSLFPEYPSTFCWCIFYSQSQASGISTTWTTLYKCILSACSGLTEADTQEAGPSSLCFSQLSGNSDAQWSLRTTDLHLRVPPLKVIHLKGLFLLQDYFKYPL